MKKIMSLLLVLLLLGSLVACGNTKVETDTDKPNSTHSTGGATSNTESDSDDEEYHADFEPRVFNTSATIEESVLVDENNVKITATELTYTGYEAEITLIIENNSDKDLSVTAYSIDDSYAINGYMIPDGYLSCDVAAGKKANEKISFDYDSLMLYGIFEIADVEISFDIYDDDYNHIYTGPRTIRTTAADGYDYETPCYRENIASMQAQAEYNYSVVYFSADAAYEENGLTIASQALMENEDGENILLLEVVNTTDEVVNVITAEFDINDLRIHDSTWNHDAINPGKTAIVKVELSSILEPEFLEAYGIKELGKVDLKVFFENSEGEEIASPAHISISIPDADLSFSLEGVELYNDNGIRIISKGVFADPSEYSDSLHILLIAENTSGKTLVLCDAYNSLSINDYMANYSLSAQTMENGSCAILDITLWGYALEEINISEPAEIKAVEFGLSIRDQNYHEIDRVTVSFTVN